MPTSRLSISFRIITVVLLVASAIGVGAKQAEPLISVTPGGSLQDAINSVPDGGIIELADGTYNAPDKGFKIYPDLSGATKSFTIRATPGATVILSGNGNTDILRFTTPKPVTFQGLTFANGSTAEEGFGGAMTMGRNVQANFVSCTFDNNSGDAKVAGGGIRIDTSTVSFQSCLWINNRSATYGAAFVADKSRVFVGDSRFIGNRINFPGHSAFSAGGAIHANGSTLRIAHSRFENNQAGYVGGAIYAYGAWTDPFDVPVMNLTVSDTLFLNNLSDRGPGSTQSAQTAGGGVTLEDQTTANFYNCRFTNNVAQQGGAISSYRTITHVHDSVFRNNEATGNSGGEGFGGSIIILSDDNNDASTVGGTRNRPTAKLTVADSLFQGPGGGAVSARQGGAIFVAGDTHANFGIGVPQNGSADTNRMVVDLKRVVFADLITRDGGNGTAGALGGDFIALTAENCIFQNCSTSHFGGALSLVRQSKATLNKISFAGNSAGILGGALRMSGGTLNVNDSSFLNNQITGAGGGTAFYTAPDGGGGTVPPSDMIGLIQNCVINSASTSAVTIYDGDSLTNGPYNRLQYSSNQIYPSDNSAYFTDVLGSFSVPELNLLIRPRLDLSAPTIKAPVDNIALTSNGVAGALLMVPRQRVSSGAPDEFLPISAYVAWTASGATPLLDGTAQNGSSAVLNASHDGAHSLDVGGSKFLTSPMPGAALNISTRLPVAQGDGALIGGFIVVGPTPKRLMVRAIGPSLPFAGALQNPSLELHDSTGATIATNDNWRTTQVGGVLGSSQIIDLFASTIPPADDSEAAIIATLAEGSYTAIIRGADNSTGIAVIEVFDLDPVQDSTLANLATRGFIQTDDDVMIGGFIYLGGPGLTKVVIRGIGPSLTAFGITNPLSDPMLELRDGNGGLVTSNDDSAQSPDVAELRSTGLQPQNSAESAIYRTGLARGAYTAIVRGKNRGTGVGLIEVYVLK
jgi:hypothetical protein